MHRHNLIFKWAGTNAVINRINNDSYPFKCLFTQSNFTKEKFSKKFGIKVQFLFHFLFHFSFHFLFDNFSPKKNSRFRVVNKVFFFIKEETLTWCTLVVNNITDNKILLSEKVSFLQFTIEIWNFAIPAAMWKNEFFFSFDMLFCRYMLFRVSFRSFLQWPVGYVVNVFVGVIKYT